MNGSQTAPSRWEQRWSLLVLLAITGLQARQIIGYTAALMLLVLPLIVLGLLVL